MDAMDLVGVQNSDWEFQFLGDDSDRLCEIGVVRDKDGNLKLLRKCIAKKVRSDVHVGPLFLCLVDEDFLRRGHTGEVHWDAVGQEVTVGDAQIRNGPQGSDVKPLVVGRCGIVGPGTNAGSEIVDLFYDVIGKHGAAKGGQVEPLPWSPLQRTIVKVEPVDIDMRSHGRRFPLVCKGLR